MIIIGRKTQRLNENEMALVREIANQCQTTEDIQNKLKMLFSGTLEQILEAEMDEHLGYDKHSLDGVNTGNSRNGYSTKKISSQFGESHVEIPRDRNGEFEPQILPKYQTKGEDIEERIIAMTAKGMSTRDIEEYLQDIYGVNASSGLISNITNKILPQITQWQNRPLSSVYPIVYFDGVYYKMRIDGKVKTVCVYSILGINDEGYKDILGIWVGDSESVAFLTTVFNDLKNRGVEKIFIACSDNLAGFGKALNSVFPEAQRQLCVIHQIRNSTKFVSYKDIKEIMQDLKLIYQATTLEEAEFQLELFAEKWDKKYPQIAKSWRENWVELTQYFKYPPEIRKIIYTTNTIEGYHRMLRKYTKNKVSFPTEDALRKSIYLSIREISKKWNLPIRDWGMIYGQLSIFFEDLLNNKTA
jgi:putative transposase